MKQRKKLISIIGQCYNEEENVELFYNHVNKVIKKMTDVDFEVIFINDCSNDNSLEIIKKISKKDQRVKYISMSKNCGKDPCAMAGFKYANGDYAVIMDIDLQDPPELIEKMYEAANEGYDIIAARAVSRNGYSFFHKIAVKMFYTIYNRISSVNLINGQRDYFMMTKKVIQELIKFHEHNLFIKGLIIDLGFNIKWIDFENVERKNGKTKFNFKRLFKYSINGIIDYSVFPLTFLNWLASFLFIVAIILIIITILFGMNGIDTNIGLFILLSIMTLLSSMIIFSMGVVGLYISQIHLEVKNRPTYIVGETNIDEFNN